MQHAFVALEWIAAAAVPSPTSTVDPKLVTPGPEGFAIMAVVALAVILLVADMMRRIRRGRVRADIREELDAEEQASRAAEATTTDAESVAADSEGPDGAASDSAEGGERPQA
jgi:hypothetical protein